VTKSGTQLYVFSHGIDNTDKLTHVHLDIFLQIYLFDAQGRILNPPYDNNTFLVNSMKTNIMNNNF